MQANVLSVLVADAHRAQLFSGTAKDGFTLQQSITPEDTHHASAPTTDPKEVATDKFAHQLSQLLTIHLQHHADASYVLVAGPHFLGLLRHALTAQVTKRVERSIDKDWLELQPKELVDRLDTELGKPS